MGQQLTECNGNRKKRVARSKNVKKKLFQVEKVLAAYTFSPRVEALEYALESRISCKQAGRRQH